jgi:hypothetical protein
MATQTRSNRKSASTTRRSSRQRPQGTSRSKASNTRSRSKASNTRSKASNSSRGSSVRSKAQSRSRASSATSRSRNSNRSSRGTGPVETVRKAVTNGAQTAGSSVGKVASNAKTPLLASGAALAGLAGGVAIGARGTRQRKVLGMPVPRRSVLKSSTKDLATAARQAGKLGQQVSELTSEVRHTREAIDSGAKRRSPIEVVLEGLTARRTQG